MIRQRLQHIGASHRRISESRGFTVVEVTIVIVVIAILATIAIVAYNGVTDNARGVSVKSDLSGTADKLAAVKYRTGSYPGSLTSDVLIQSPGNVLSYQVTSTGFCLQGRNTQAKQDTRLFVTQDGKIASGTCPITFTQIAAGYDFNCGLTFDARVYCWGTNTSGKLGDGTTTTQSTPVPLAQGAIPSTVTIKQVAAGYSHACALGSDGEVYCWGDNSYRQLGDGTTTSRLTPVAVLQGAMPAGVTATSLISGNYHNCVIGSDTRVYCWGYNSAGQLGDGTGTSKSSPVALAQGAVPNGVTIAQLSGGGSHTCARASDGNAYCWGFNSTGQLGDGTLTNRSAPTLVVQGAIPVGVTIQQVAAGSSSSCAIGSDNEPYCWGNNNRNQLGDGTTTVRSSPVLVSQGVIPVSVTLSQLMVGDSHACVVASNNQAYCWGYNYGGQLGDNTTINRSAPVAVMQGSIPGGVTLRQLSGGAFHTCGLASDGLLYCWGQNVSRQLGDGTGINRLTPVPVTIPAS